MVLVSCCAGRCPARFPHARGDGPRTTRRMYMYSGFSPRPWGWSDPSSADQAGQSVFPTPVGMVLIFFLIFFDCWRFPHARGDGPYRRMNRWKKSMFSPRPWGWSFTVRAGVCEQIVFPTPVGMVRRLPQRRNRENCFPHARGDGPRMHNMFCW